MEYFIEFIVNIILNNFDMFNLYYLFCSLTNKKPNFTKRGVFLGIIWGTILGICITTVNLNLYKLFFHVSVIIILHMLYKKKIHDAIILYILFNVLIFTIQLCGLFIITRIETNEIITLLFIQIFTSFTIIIASSKLPIYQMFHVFKNNMLLKCIFFTLNIVFFSVMFYINFEIEDMRPLIILYVLLFSISLIGFWQTVKLIYTLTENIQSSQHEFGNIITAMVGIVYSSDDISCIRKQISEYINVIHAEFESEAISKEDINNVEIFIKQKSRKAKNKKIEIQSKILYEPNILIPELSIIELTGILIDNAIEESAEGTFIILLVFSDLNNLIIEVTNPCDNILLDNMNRMFTKKYSTKKKTDNETRGYGLYNVKKIVKKYHGEIFLQEKYSQGKSCITIRIEIRDCIDKHNTNDIVKRDNVT